MNYEKYEYCEIMWNFNVHNYLFIETHHTCSFTYHLWPQRQSWIEARRPATSKIFTICHLKKKCWPLKQRTTATFPPELVKRWKRSKSAPSGTHNNSIMGMLSLRIPDTPRRQGKDESGYGWKIWIWDVDWGTRNWQVVAKTMGLGKRIHGGENRGQSRSPGKCYWEVNKY